MRHLCSLRIIKHHIYAKFNMRALPRGTNTPSHTKGEMRPVTASATDVTRPECLPTRIKDFSINNKFISLAIIGGDKYVNNTAVDHSYRQIQCKEYKQ